MVEELSSIWASAHRLTSDWPQTGSTANLSRPLCSVSIRHDQLTGNGLVSDSGLVLWKHKIQGLRGGFFSRAQLWLVNPAPWEHGVLLNIPLPKAATDPKNVSLIIANTIFSNNCSHQFINLCHNVTGRQWSVKVNKIWRGWSWMCYVNRGGSADRQRNTLISPQWQNTVLMGLSSQISLCIKRCLSLRHLTEKNWRWGGRNHMND